jgi:hypothetical protein
LTNSQGDSLNQLKKASTLKGGIIKNTFDARKHLVTAGLTTPEEPGTQETITKILLSLVVTLTVKRNTGEKILENFANIIKASALLLDEIATKTPALKQQSEDTVSPKASLDTSPTCQAHQDLRTQLKSSVNDLKTAMTSQAEANKKASTLINKLERLHESMEKKTKDIEQTRANNQATYRDILVHGKSSLSLHSPSQHRLLNQLNIKACQLMVEFEADTHTKVPKPSPQSNDPTLIIRNAINTWLSSLEDQNGPLPTNAKARSIKIFGNSCLFIKMNSVEAVNWMKANPNHIIGDILKCKTRVLTRTYAVIARFVPVTFKPTATNLKLVEDDLSLPNSSIEEAVWIKHPSKHSKVQKYANLKILCSTPEAANTLITRPTYILGSHLSIQKDIKTPGVCNKCQQYSHIVRDCKEMKDTCGQCAGEHQTSLCINTTECKCTPCGSTEHTTNHPECPVYQQHKTSMIDWDPEAMSPYYLTQEEWTWGHHLNPIDPPPNPTDAHSSRKDKFQRSRPSRLSSHKGTQHGQHQQTLKDNWFTRHHQSDQHSQTNPTPSEPHKESNNQETDNPHTPPQ